MGNVRIPGKLLRDGRLPSDRCAYLAGSHSRTPSGGLVLWCCQEQSTASKLRAAVAGSWKAVPGFWKLVLVVRDGHSDRAFGSQQGEIDC